jgi:serine/threonine protein kinase
MGVVYKAEDERLGRIVALKVIRELGSDPTVRRRFWVEARAAAQVAHPSACRLYDIAEEGDCLVLVMEFIEGESLTELIARGPLPAQEASQIVLGILSALTAFHQAGIIHRDLKPGNILISASGTKLLDFGLAKQLALHSADETASIPPDATNPGTFLGTPRYASPEQFRNQPADARSDLFSLGAIFFETLTGQRAFPGESLAEVAHSVLYGSPPALSGSPAISAMGRIVHRALERDPKDRYSSAESMAADLRAALLMDGIDTKVSAHPLRRLIVLPFRILRPNQEIEFLAYSLPEAITVSLAGLENLIVRSSVAASGYSADAPDLQKIAQEAEVDVVLTGVLLSVGEQLRITTQLVEVPSGTLIWSHSSNATVRDLLELHDDLVARVVQSVAPSLTVQENRSLQQDRPASAEVYQYFLQANELTRRWQDVPAAIELYERCVSMDASYAPAWARLGRARWLDDKYGRNSPEGMRSADEAFQTALRLNPNLTLAHNLYTALQVDQGHSLAAMKRLLDRAQLRRSDAELFAGLAHACRYCGLLQASVVAHREARRLDPLIQTSVLHTYLMLGDYQRALEHAHGDFGYSTAMVLVGLGRREEAITILKEREAEKPGRLALLYFASLRALLEGKRDESIAASDELMTATFRDPEGLYYIARQLSYLGEPSRALEILAHAIDRGFFCYPAMVRDPWLDSLRARSEFTASLKKCHELHRGASAAFLAAGGNSLLGLRTE